MVNFPTRLMKGVIFIINLDYIQYKIWVLSSKSYLFLGSNSQAALCHP